MGWLRLLYGWVGAIGRLLGRLFSMLKASRYFKWFYWYLFINMGGLVEKFLRVLGISFVVNKWLVPEIRPFIVEKFIGLPPAWTGFVGLLKLDQAITVLLSAIVIAGASKVSAQRRSDALNTPL